jgi:hypothetical protein
MRYGEDVRNRKREEEEKKRKKKKETYCSMLKTLFSLVVAHTLDHDEENRSKEKRKSELRKRSTAASENSVLRRLLVGVEKFL